ncbi:MAG: phosphorylase [Microcoleaceae cyanobacterium]
MLKPGQLWTRIQEQTQFALQSGALQPISTISEVIEAADIPFLVRTSTNVARKQAVAEQRKEKTDREGKPFNPFQPYEQDLFVADLSSTHLCLLNKFNVVDHHILMVTQEFEEQDNLLTIYDFEAMWIVLSEIDGLVFYNGGKVAGASQPHKHLQWVPLPLTGQEHDSDLKLPIETAINQTQYQGAMGKIPQFPFEHGIVRLNPDWATIIPDAAAASYEYYKALLHHLGIQGSQGMIGQQSAPYNFLATRDWMLVIPRSEEKFEQISVNSLGFAGTLFVRYSEQMQRLREIGPLNLLQQVGGYQSGEEAS